MEVVKVFWWKHNNKIGQYSSAKVHNSLKVVQKEDVTVPSRVEDYNIEIQNLKDLNVEVIEGM